MKHITESTQCTLHKSLHYEGGTVGSLLQILPSANC